MSSDGTRRWTTILVIIIIIIINFFLFWKLWATKIAKERQDLLSEDKMNVLAYQYPAKILQSSYQAANSQSIANKKLEIIVQFEERKIILDQTPHSRPSDIIQATLGKVSI